MIKIAFYFPYKYPSGVSHLFIRLAEVFACKYRIPIDIIDLEDGFMHKNIINDLRINKVKIIKNAKIIIDNDTIIVMQSTLPYSLYKELVFSDNTRIFYWNLFPYNLIPDILPHLFRNVSYWHKIEVIKKLILITQIGNYKRLKRFYNLLEIKNAIVFQDNYSKKLLKEFYGSNKNVEDILPVPVNEIEYKYNKRIDGTLELGWVGRLHNFKIHILIFTLQKFKAVAEIQKRSINFHIIGGGPEEELLDEISDTSYFKVIRLGDMVPRDLNLYLFSKIHLLFAMGTSALEGAKMGIPTVLLDFSFNKIRYEYKFKWLYESEIGDIGHLIDQDELGKTATELVEELLKNKEMISKKCFSFCSQHYDIEIICKELISKIEASSLHYKDIESNIYKKNICRKIYENYFREY